METATTTSRAIRVAMVVRPASGGMLRHVETLLANLDTTKYALTLFAPADSPLSQRDAQVRFLPFAIQARISPLRDAVSLLRLAHHLRGNFDLVHAHGLRGALIGVLAARRVKIPALFTAHNLVPPTGRLTASLLAHLGRSADCVIAVSEAVSLSLQAVGVARKKIAVIPNGLSLAPFDAPYERAVVRARYGVSSDAPVVVAVGRFAPEKGFDVLLKAARRLQSRLPEARVLLVGNGPQEAELRADAPETVIFTGRLSEVAPLLAASDVVAVPSRAEGQGLVALEAMAARRPVVASRVGGLVETVLDPETGLLVPPDAPEALADALLTLLRDPARCAASGRAGRERVEQHYTLPEMIERTEAIYRRVLSSNTTD